MQLNGQQVSMAEQEAYHGTYSQQEAYRGRYSQQEAYRGRYSQQLAIRTPSHLEDGLPYGQLNRLRLNVLDLSSSQV